jgi:hypothetical protein
MTGSHPGYTAGHFFDIIEIFCRTYHGTALLAVYQLLSIQNRSAQRKDSLTVPVLDQYGVIGTGFRTGPACDASFLRQSEIGFDWMIKV